MNISLLACLVLIIINISPVIILIYSILFQILFNNIQYPSLTATVIFCLMLHKDQCNAHSLSMKPCWFRQTELTAAWLVAWSEVERRLRHTQREQTQTHRRSKQQESWGMRRGNGTMTETRAECGTECWSEQQLFDGDVVWVVMYVVPPSAATAK